MNENAWTEIVQILFQAYTEIDMDDDFLRQQWRVVVVERGWIMHGIKGNFLFIDIGGNSEKRDMDISEIINSDYVTSLRHS